MSRELLQQALDALDRAISDDRAYIRECKDAAEAIRAHLAAQPAPAVPVSWDRLRVLMDGIPTREEFIGGQRQKYVAKEAVMSWLHEGQLRAKREAVQPAAPTVQVVLRQPNLFASAPAVREPIIDEMDAVASKYAHKLALDLECVLSDYNGRWWGTAMQTLGGYRSAMNTIHERESPTHMGEPAIAARKDRR